MKKLFLLFTFLCIASCLFAQVSKTVNVASAGTLYPSISFNELKTITNLTVTGKIDARDLRLMRNMMTSLTVVDLSGATIVRYTPYFDNAIPDSAFYNCYKLTSVTVPSSTSSIGKKAFMWCKGLTSSQIPSSVTFIGESAFFGCSKLTSTTIPSSAKKIEDFTFQGCEELTSVTIPSSVTEIGERAFADCSKLAVTIPSSVTKIGDGAFQNCYNLTSVTIPSSVTTIKTGAFQHCVNLTSVTIPSSLTAIEDYTFSSCEKLTSVIIPSSVTSIGYHAFYHCDNLALVKINSNITYLGEGAFYDCNLKSIEISSITPPFLSSDYSVGDVFGYKTEYTLYVPLGSGMAYSKFKFWSGFNRIVEKAVTGLNPITFDRELTVFPNPTTDFIILNVKQSIDKTTLFSILDINGKSIITKEISSQRTQIDLKAFPSGTYFCQIFINGQKLEAVKLIKK